MDRMACRIDRDIGSDLAVVADHYFADVNDRAVVVYESIFADLDIVAVVAVEGRVDPCPFGLAKELTDDGFDTLKIGAVHGVELLGEPAGSFLFIHDGWIRDVQNLAVSAFLVGHMCPPV